MNNTTQAIQELEAKRASLKPLYLAAKEQSKTAEMKRLVTLASEIDDLLDDLVFDAFSDLALRLSEIAQKVNAAKKRAENPTILLSPLIDGDDEDEDEVENQNVPTAVDGWRSLVEKYQHAEIEFPNLKAITLAQWILESGRGTSGLAQSHNNFAGMKWRTPMQPFGKRVLYKAHDGSGYYTHFNSFDQFIHGFWRFLDRSPYDGWRGHTASSEDFIEFIGPIWAGDKNYSEKVLDLLDEAQDLLKEPSHQHKHGGDDYCSDCGPGGEIEKPLVNRWETTSHHSSRKNADIDHIVIHYTTSRNIEGSISHFKHGSPRTSAHYIIGRDGALVQMVKDSDNAWHAGSSVMNRRSIGIEHVAKVGDAITNSQARTSIKLISWLMEEYEIPKKNVIPHNCVKATSCCGELFKNYGGHGDADCETQKSALHAWMSDNGIS